MPLNRDVVVVMGEKYQIKKAIRAMIKYYYKRESNFKEKKC